MKKKEVAIEPKTIVDEEYIKNSKNTAIGYYKLAVSTGIYKKDFFSYLKESKLVGHDKYFDSTECEQITIQVIKELGKTLQ